MRINKGFNLPRYLFLAFVFAMGLMTIIATGGSDGAGSAITDNDQDNNGVDGENGDSQIPSPDWVVESDQEGLRLGWSVASAGDVNGDGYSDVIINNHLMYYGSASGLSTTASDWTPDSIGRLISPAGDVNNDGYSDVIVGDGWGYGLSDNTWASIYYGSASGIMNAPGWTADYGSGNNSFSLSVASAGDVNGDGYSDIIVGTYYDEYSYPLPTETNTFFLYYGSASGPGSVADWTWNVKLDKPAYPAVNASAYPVGDINGDGYSDIIIDSPRYFVDSLIYYGSSSGLSSVGTDWNGPIIVATPGDINGDGYADVIVSGLISSNGDPISETDHYPIYYGSSSGLQDKSSTSLVLPFVLGEGDEIVNKYLEIKAAGDVNNDGCPDVIVTSLSDRYMDYDNDIFGWNKYNVFIYCGSKYGFGSRDADWSVEFNNKFPWDEESFSASTAGDVDGDLSSEIIIGDLNYSTGGRVLVYSIDTSIQ